MAENTRKNKQADNALKHTAEELGALIRRVEEHALELIRTKKVMDLSRGRSIHNSSFPHFIIQLTHKMIIPNALRSNAYFILYKEPPMALSNNPELTKTKSIHDDQSRIMGSPSPHFPVSPSSFPGFREEPGTQSIRERL